MSDAAKDEIPLTDADLASMEAPVPRALGIPRRLGRYVLSHEIASGGMASVNLARAEGHGGFEKVVAIKCIHPHLASDPTFVEMFMDEARLASRIDHPNVCRVFDFGHIENTHFIVMEYIVGETLVGLLQRVFGKAREADRARLSVYAAKIIADACEGLHAAHELKGDGGELLGLVHRDISPQNLFVCYDGSVRLVDFGVAKATGRSHHTQTGVLKGKLAYMAPEQLRRRPIDRRADIWALGVVLWELVTGKRLFRRESEIETILAIEQEPPPDPSTLCPSLPKEIDAIIARALQRDPAARYATAREMARDLNRYIARAEDPVGVAEMAEWMEAAFRDVRDGRLRAMDEARGTISERLAREPEPAAARVPSAAAVPTEAARPAAPRALSAGKVAAPRPAASDAPASTGSDPGSAVVARESPPSAPTPELAGAAVPSAKPSAAGGVAKSVPAAPVAVKPTAAPPKALASTPGPAKPAAPVTGAVKPLAGAPGVARPSAAKPAVPAVATPVAAKPASAAVATPEVTKPPAVAMPAVANLAVANPAVAVVQLMAAPAVVAPAVVAPAVVAPAVVAPAVVAPAVVAPAVVAPAVVAPAVVAPAVVAPAVVAPAVVVPAVAAPAVAAPAVAAPPVAAPPVAAVIASPVAAMPVGPTKPAAPVEALSAGIPAVMAAAEPASQPSARAGLPVAPAIVIAPPLAIASAPVAGVLANVPSVAPIESRPILAYDGAPVSVSSTAALPPFVAANPTEPPVPGRRSTEPSTSAQAPAAQAPAEPPALVPALAEPSFSGSRRSLAMVIAFAAVAFVGAVVVTISLRNTPREGSLAPLSPPRGVVVPAIAPLLVPPPEAVVAVEPVVAEPTAVEPVLVEPAAVEPAAVEPAAVEPAVEPVAVEPVPVEPVEAVRVERAQAGPVEPTTTPARTPRSESAPVAQGFVNVATPGGWADVYVEGHHFGTTPIRIELPVGRRVVELRPSGGSTRLRRTVQVRSGAMERLVVPIE